MSKLIPMTQTEYEAFLEHMIPDYAAENVKAGYWDELEALEKSRKQTESLFPQGLQSKDNYLYTLHDGEDAVGLIWMKAEMDRPQKSGFIYDVEIYEKFRGKGYGREIMLLVEDKARELGLQSIGLHVFASNRVARNLYESIGYETSSLNMIKKL